MDWNLLSPRAFPQAQGNTGTQEGFFWCVFTRYLGSESQGTARAVPDVLGTEQQGWQGKISGLWAGSEGGDWGLCYPLPLHPVMCLDLSQALPFIPAGWVKLFHPIPGEGGRDSRGMRCPQPRG